jgi:hypothetical protein
MVLIDPPFLSEECMGGFIQSARFISKPDARFLGATGAKLPRDLQLSIWPFSS